MEIKTAAIQMGSSFDRDLNIKKASRLITVAAEKGAKLVALPELFANHWFPAEARNTSRQMAEGRSGPTITAMKKLSKKFDIVIVAPFFEKAGSRAYNSAAVIDNGNVAGIYRKVHIPSIPLWEEKHYFSAGSSFPVFETSLGRIAVQICWDNFFWEGYRSLALAGARLVITPTASAFSTQKRWQEVIKSHALLNTIYIMRVNRVGKEKHQEFYGGSFMVAPDGELVNSAAGRAEGISFSNIDLGEVTAARSVFPFLEDRRVMAYKSATGRFRG